MSEEFDYHVFISYSHDDAGWVEGTLLPRLEAARLRVCIDFRDFPAGHAALSNMEDAVQRSRHTLLVLTPSWVASQWSRYEAILARADDPAGLQRRTVPLLLKPCEGLPKSISILSWVDFTRPDRLEIAWNRLLTDLVAHPATQPIASPPSQDGWLLVHPYPMPPNFTGRAAERQMLSGWLEGNGPPLFVLRALGGFGKSALIWYWLLHDVDPGRWPRVLWWSFYETEAAFERFLAHTLAYLGIDPKPLTPHEQVEVLLSALRRPGVLLVLDGFERELRAFASLGAAYQGDEEAAAPGEDDRECVSPFAEVFLRGIAGWPGIRGRVILTTHLRPRGLESRSGELISGCWEKEITALQPEDAVLFLRAEGIRGARGEIETACAQYGYHPLSLRLLAGLVLHDPHSPGDIAAVRRLDATGDLVQRHHVLEQSYESLPPGERRLLSRIACFRGTVSYEAVAATASEASPEEIDRFLRDLTARGLLHRDPRESRFDLHPIVRRYAYDRLGQEEQQAAHRTLRDYFAAMPAPERIQTLTDLAPVVELYHHMVRSGEYDAAWELFRDRLGDATYFQLGAYELCIELLRTLFPDGEDRPPRLGSEDAQAWTLNALGNSYSLSGQPRKAVALFKLGVEIDTKLGYKNGLAVGLGNLAEAERKIGALKFAESRLRQRIVLGRDVEGESRQEVIGHQELGHLLGYLGRWTEAHAELDQALKAPGEHSQFRGVTWAYVSRLYLQLLRAEDLDEGSQLTPLAVSKALAAARHALELAEETEQAIYLVERDYVRAHWLLGAASCASGDLPVADHHLSEALTRCRRISLVEDEADILLDLARLRLAAGDQPEARQLAEEALAIIERSGYVLEGADVHLLLARLDLEEGNEAEARRHAAEARRLATCDGPPDYTYKVAYDEAGALLERLGGGVSTKSPPEARDDFSRPQEQPSRPRESSSRPKECSSRPRESSS